MARRKIQLEGSACLRMRCREVTEVDDRVRAQLEDMLDTLHATPNGAALAASQVGILKRMVVIDFGDGAVLRLVNPRIVKTEGEQTCVEGCLSFPGRFGKTVRPQRVVVHAQDEKGRFRSYRAEGEMAKCFCHEIDHLDGILLPDRVIAWEDTP